MQKMQSVKEMYEVEAVMPLIEEITTSNNLAHFFFFFLLKKQIEAHIIVPWYLQGIGFRISHGYQNPQMLRSTV